MSKRHKHKHDYELEHMRQSFITEEQLLILILVILVFRERPSYSYVDRCKYCCNDKCKYNTKNTTKYDCGYSGGQEPHYNDIEEKTDDNELRPYSFEGSLYTAKPEFQSEPTHTKDFKGEDVGEDDEDNGECECVAENKLTIADTSINEACEKTIEESPTEKPIITRPKVKVCSLTLLQSCPNDNIEEAPSLEPVVSKIPVIISQPQLQILIETLTVFPEPVFQIKTVDKKVFLDSCQLILGSDKIFVKGFIQEDVEYCTADFIKPTAINGNIKKITFNISFQCSSKVFFNIEPQVFNSYGIFDLDVIDTSTNGINLYEKSQENVETLNEKVFAELDSSKILETDIQEEIKPLDNILQEVNTFERMRKKIILNLKLSLLQNQKIFIYNPISTS